MDAALDFSLSVWKIVLVMTLPQVEIKKYFLKCDSYELGIPLLLNSYTKALTLIIMH